MKVLYFHQFFNTPQKGGSIRSFLLASELVKSGYEVELITSHTGRKKKTLNIEGIRVTYLPIKYNNSFGFWGRIIAYLKFAFWASIESVKTKHVDFCYIMTTPLTTGLIGLFNKYFLRRPYIFEVGDLWPLVPIQMGVIQNKLLSNILFWWEKKFYQASAGSIGLSPPITEYIQNLNPDLPTETVYNMSDCDFFVPKHPSKELKNKYGIGEEFVITYTGTFGLANDLTRMMEVIDSLRHLPIKFLFIGMGAEKEKVTNRANELNLDNCSIMGFQTKDGMKEILTISDAMFISFANYDSLFTGSPNKLFDALAAGLVVITNFDGWIKDLIEDESCGFSFKHDSAADFERNIFPLLNDPKKLATYKNNSRSLAESRYALKLQSQKQIDFLKKEFG